MSRRHSTKWEDDGCAGLACDDVDVGQVVHSERDEICARCGATVRLRWIVYVEDVTEAKRQVYG